jgi:hypothetical protein
MSPGASVVEANCMAQACTKQSSLAVEVTVIVVVVVV